MTSINQTLEEVKNLYQEVVGQPVPKLGPEAYIGFPPGLDPVEHANREVQELRRLAEQVAAAPQPVGWIPVADHLLAPDAVFIRLDVPGASREDLKVFVAGSECVVRGERKPPSLSTDLRPLTNERPYGRFERRFMLPTGSQGDGLTARYRDGVLELRIPVTAPAAATPKAVTVE